MYPVVRLSSFGAEPITVDSGSRRVLVRGPDGVETLCVYRVAVPLDTDGPSDRRSVADVQPRDGLVRPADGGSHPDAPPVNAGEDAGEDPKQAEFRAVAENFCRAACDCSRPLEGVPPDESCEIGVQGCCTAYSLLDYETCIRGEISNLKTLDRWCARLGDQSCGCERLSLCMEFDRTITCDAPGGGLSIPVECFAAAIPTEEQCCTDPRFGWCDKPL